MPGLPALVQLGFIFPVDCKISCQELIKGVLLHGWENCPWSDDLLASRKILPGFTPRMSNKLWNERLRTSDESCLLFVKHVLADFEKTPPANRRKTAKVLAEDSSSLCALAVNLAREVQNIMPLSSATLQAEFLDKVAVSDPKVISELQLAMTEKVDKFHPRMIGTLNALMDAHSGKAPITEGAMMQIEKGQIEKSTFELHMKQLEYDLQTFKVFDSKMNNFFTARDHILRQWKLDALTENRKAVDHYMSSFCYIGSFEETDMERQVMRFVKDIEKRLQLDSKHVVQRASDESTIIYCKFNVCAI